MSFRLYIFAGLFAILCSPGLAEPGRSIRVADLIASSDLVVAGQYAQTEVDPGRSFKETVRIDRFIKGRLPNDDREIVLGRYDGTPHALSRYGLFFLRGSAGHFEQTDAQVFALPASPPKFQYLRPSGDALNQATAELVDVFSIPPDATIKIFGLSTQNTIVGLPNGYDKSGRVIFKSQPATGTWLSVQAYSDADEASLFIPASVRVPYLLKVINEAGTPMLGRVWACMSLVAAGDKSCLHSINSYLLHPDDDYASKTNTYLCLALERVLSTEQDGPFFAALLSSRSALIREGALYQINNLHSDVALRALDIAIRDDNPNVRQEALRGVCGHVSVCGRQTVDYLARPENVRPIAAAYSAWLLARH